MKTTPPTSTPPPPFLSDMQDFLRDARWGIAHNPREFLAEFLPTGSPKDVMISAPMFDENGVHVGYWIEGDFKANDTLTLFVSWKSFLSFYRHYV